MQPQRGHLSRHLINFHPEVSKVGVYYLSSEGQPGPTDASTVKEERVVYQFEVVFNAPDTSYKWNINRTYEQFRCFARDLNREAMLLDIKQVPALLERTRFMGMQPTERLDCLEAYLFALIPRADIRLTTSFLEFLEVSAFSFDGTSAKHKEGYVNKRTGGRRANEHRTCNCSKYFRRLQRRWLIIKDTMIGYTTSNTSEVLHESLLFKGKFVLQVGEQHTGYPDGMRIATSQRVLTFRAGSEVLMREWQEAIRQAYEHSEWNATENIYGSSFPLRTGNQVEWYIDGESYFKAVYDALVAAQRAVFISDWWLSPELYLLRPAGENEKSQLVEVLGTLADRGVAVNVCIYKEVKFALTLNSVHTKDVLKARSDKIKVLRHPQRSVVGGEFLWSHHEKVVVIDQQVAFLGGLDLCFGRWDTQAHPLFDGQPQMWPGIDFSNIRVSDFTDVENWKRDSVNRKEVPRMPWHDVSLKIVGKAASDVALHFIELWNHVMTDITGEYHKSKDLLHPGTIEPEKSQLTPIVEVMVPPPSPIHKVPFDIVPDANDSPKVYNRQRSRTVFGRKREVHCGNERRKTIGASCKHFNVTFLTNISEDQEARSRAVHVNESPVKPEEKATVLAKLSPQQDQPTGLLRSNTVVLGSTALDENEKEIQDIFGKGRGSDVILRVRSEIDHERREAIEEEIEKRELQEGEDYAKHLLQMEQKLSTPAGSCECQLLRSGGRWSLGLEETEVSVHTGYLRLIDQAEHFIYIENQFFISSTAGAPVKNQVAQALIERIKSAAATESNFRVIVVIPLLPAFEGAVDDSSAALLRVELHWEYETIVRGARSIFQQLKSEANIPDPSRYIQFYGLRTHAKSPNGTPVTEIVYVHSKLMIVDDEYLLIGSANINDRSMLGSHDSEVAVIVRDTARTHSRLSGAPMEVSSLVKQLRIALFKEHSGTNDEAVLEDPLSEEFAQVWDERAKVNTEFYRRVFQCYPDDHMQKIEQIRVQERTALKASYDPEEPRGSLVTSTQTLFPLGFLSKEYLKLSIFNKEFYIPEENFI